MIAKLVGGWPTLLKNMSSSVEIMKFPIYGKIKFMFQSTNQIYVYIYIPNITYINISGKRLQFANWKITIFKFDTLW